MEWVYSLRANGDSRIDERAELTGYVHLWEGTRAFTSSEDTGCPCQEEDQETARGGIGCRAGERAGRIGLGRAAAHGRRRTRAVLQRRGSVRHELSVAGAPVRQAIASGADESLRRRLYHLVLIRQNS
jgi:hypothetical protein